MEGRQYVIVMLLGAIALGWFIGSGAKGFNLPELPKAPAASQEPASGQGTEPDQIDQLWKNVGQNIGQDPQAAIDTVKAWRDRANSEMEYEPAPLISSTYHASNYTPMSYGPPFSSGRSQPASPPPAANSGRSVAIGSGFPDPSTAGSLGAPGGSNSGNLPGNVTISSPAR